MEPTRTYGPIADLVASIDERLASAKRGLVDGLGSAGPELDSARGRRMPSLILLLSAECAGGAGPRSISMATVAEFTHAASVFHDAVMDDAALQRRPSEAGFDRRNQISILLGDYLLSHALSVLVAEKNLALLPDLIGVVARMCDGQARELGARGRAIPEAEYLEILRAKAGSLPAFCGKAGALTAGGSEEWADALEAFGERFGIAFHINGEVTDVMEGDADPRAAERVLGADRGLTLPLSLVARNGRRDRGALERIRQEGEHSPGDMKTVCQLAESTGAISRCRELVDTWLAAAHEQLATLPESEAVRQLVRASADLCGRRPHAATDSREPSLGPAPGQALHAQEGR
jgi:geranylgeranyl pyrophosphate synthase